MVVAKQKSEKLQKRVKLDNGKTIIVETAQQKSKDPFAEVASLLSDVPNLKPCD